MAQKLRKPDNEQVKFPPEADADFEIVSDQDIASWRADLEKRYGIGKGKLVVIEEPA